MGVPAANTFVDGSPAGSTSFVNQSIFRRRVVGEYASPRLFPSSSTTSVGRRLLRVMPSTRPPAPRATISHPFRNRMRFACQMRPRPADFFLTKNIFAKLKFQNTLFEMQCEGLD
jgi:hypothetical protein